MLAPCGVGFLVVCDWCLAIPQKAAGNRAYTFFFAMSQMEKEQAMNTTLTQQLVLPDWLDNIIYTKLGGLYTPDHVKFSYNLGSSKADILTYLGTYFPRSYAEAYFIMCDLFSHGGLRSVFDAKDEIYILDFGCGTGGEIFGTLCAFHDIFGDVKKYRVVAIDGNPAAVRILRRIFVLFKAATGIDVTINVASVCVDDASDMELLGSVIDRQFDIVLSFKAVNEFIQSRRFSDNAYSHFAEMLVPKLSDSGLFVLLDVTTRDSVSGVFYPVLMNSGIAEYLRHNPAYSSLLPLPCALYGNECRERCYMQRRFSVSQSRRKNDISKVAYRVICRKSFFDELGLANRRQDASYYINANNGAVCPHFIGREIKNGFKLI